MELEEDDIREALREMHDRCSIAAAIGIPHQRVVESRLKMDGYWLDPFTAFWIPVAYTEADLTRKTSS